jgi:Ca2+-binding RTX toxin-like protein
VPANVAPTATADAIVANKASTSFTIPSGALLWNDVDPDHDPLTLTSPLPVTFTSAANAHAIAFNYTESDGTHSVVGNVTVTTHDTNSAVAGTNQNDFVALDAYVAANGYNGVVSFDGQQGNDVIIGTSGGGSYLLNGGNGDDFLFSASTTDTVWNQSARTILNGGNGEDRLEALGRGSELNGENGNDIIVGHALQSLSGGSGADTFILATDTPFNKVTISDYKASEGDKIDLSSLLNSIFQGHNNSEASKFVHVSSGGMLEIDPTGQSGANNHWQAVAGLTGISSTDIVNVVFNDHQFHIQGNSVTG